MTETAAPFRKDELVHLDFMARRYGALPSELLALTPDELRLVADVADAGAQADQLRMDAAAAQKGVQPVLNVGPR